MSKKLQYQQQNSPQTLQEGLDEYYASFPGLITKENNSHDVAELFKLHDVTHVIFGCGTSIREETLTDIWTIFGSTVSLKQYMDYLKYPETTQVVKDIGFLKVIWIALQTLPAVIKVIFHTRKMKKKLLWGNYQQYLHRSLQEIREEFNIILV
ncbi:MAG: hypothetical protein QNJ47_10850 [Nostocaceae cyanobacterium]|nr:hypothetical protein [Nostocaceae cyanobacterium]